MVTSTNQIKIQIIPIGKETPGHFSNVPRMPTSMNKNPALKPILKKSSDNCRNCSCPDSRTNNVSHDFVCSSRQFNFFLNHYLATSGEENVDFSLFHSHRNDDHPISECYSIVEADRAAGLISTKIPGNRIKETAQTRRKVIFGHVSIREYDRVFGDNPSCRRGPPLSLGWSYSEKMKRSLDEYEMERCRIRPRKLFCIGKCRRKNLLTYWGYSQEEMKEARRKTKQIQFQRSATKALRPIYLAQEGFIMLKTQIHDF